MSVQQAVWINNHLPSRKTGLSSHDLWSKTKHPLRKLHDTHVFGCPVCVLQKRLSDGMSMPRWERRSKQGVCVGMSEKHAGNAPLVLNFETGNITAQWNVVFDDWFSTVATNVEEMPDFNADEWSKMFGTSTFDSQPDDEETESDLRPVQPTSWDIEDDTIDEEAALRQKMLVPNPLIQPDQPTTPPTRTHSQVTSEHVNRHSESPS